jgi:DNA polymerase-1
VILDNAAEQQRALGEYLQDELDPLIMDSRIAKRDTMQAELDRWNLAIETAEWDYRMMWYEWQHYQKNIDGHSDMQWDLSKWNDWKINKTDQRPEGQRRYVKWMLKEKWRPQNPRPAPPKLDQNHINLNSADQMLIAFAQLGITLEDFRGATVATALTQTDDEKLIEMLNSLLLYKKATKLLTAFGPTLIEKIGPDGRLRGNFNQIGTATGRPSCSRPNLLQIPKRGKNKYFRRVFIPGAGNLFIRADYSQMELRLVAEMADDTNMKKAFKENFDLHTYTASLMFKTKMDRVSNDQRATAKTINFGILYGMGPTKLRTTLAVDGIRLSKDEAYAAVQLWKKTYPQAARWIERTGIQAGTQGWTATTLGRKRYFELPAVDEQSKYAIRREGANHPIQGGNADITKLAMVAITALLHGKGTIVLTVYDEILVEVPAELAQWARDVVYSCMMAASEQVLLTVPSAVEAQITTSWSDEDTLPEPGA